jgi:aconitase B
MQGAIIFSLIDSLEDTELAQLAANQLSHTILIFEKFNDIEQKARNGMCMQSGYCVMGECRVVYRTRYA